MRAFYNVFLWFWEKFIWKMSSLLFREILGMFLNTLTADDKYPDEDWENLQLPIQNAIIWKTLNFLAIFCSIYGICIKF